MTDKSWWSSSQSRILSLFLSNFWTSWMILALVRTCSLYFFRSRYKSFCDAIPFPSLSTCDQAHLTDSLRKNNSMSKLLTHVTLQGRGSHRLGSRSFRSFTNWSGSKTTIKLGSSSFSSRTFEVSEKSITAKVCKKWLSGDQNQRSNLEMIG